VSPTHAGLVALRACTRPLGSGARTLAVGPWRIAFEGLDETLAATLDARWGGFCLAAPDAAATLTVRCVGSATPWLPAAPGESYRIEADLDDGMPVVRSYRFLAGPEAPGLWRAAVVRDGGEPEGRILDNLARWFLARCAVESGGLALHGAGVVWEGRAFLFGGKSRSGKSTAVRLSAPAGSLGDDFAVTWPADGAWWTCAVPFDNAERAPASPGPSRIRLARLCRLIQAPAASVEPVLPPAAAAAALLSLAAFPWALPDLLDDLAANASAFVGAGPGLTDLRFRVDPDFWTLLVRD
jgi:hypothetical protein